MKMGMLLATRGASNLDEQVYGTNIRRKYMTERAARTDDGASSA